jgi:methylated-DNA-[protein]-cysteine S-methyltransferase
MTSTEFFFDRSIEVYELDGKIFLNRRDTHPRHLARCLRAGQTCCYTRLMKTFSDKVRDIVRKIPKGKTMTYKAVAAKAGNPKAARAVGAIMRTNYDPSIPCHCVIASDGSMRGYVRPRRRPAQQ